MIWSKKFWAGVFERAVKTGAQVAVATFAIGTTGLLDVDWVGLGSIVGAAVIASVLTSIGNANFVAGTPDTIVVPPVSGGDV